MISFDQRFRIYLDLSNASEISWNVLVHMSTLSMIANTKVVKWLLTVSLGVPSPVNWAKDSKTMSVTREEAGEDRPPCYRLLKNGHWDLLSEPCGLTSPLYTLLPLSTPSCSYIEKEQVTKYKIKLTLSVRKIDRKRYQCLVVLELSSNMCH